MSNLKQLTKPTKWLGALTQIQLPNSLFVQYLLSCFASRPISNIMFHIGANVGVGKVGFSDGFVCFVEGGAEDIFDSYKQDA